MDMPISLSLIGTDDGEEITTIPLIQCSGFLTGAVMIPNTTFQYQLRGTDIHGFAFEHTSNRLVESTPPDERSVTQLDCPTPLPTVTASTATPRPTVTASTATPRPPGGSASTNFMPASIINSIIVATAIVLGIIM